MNTELKELAEKAGIDVHDGAVVSADGRVALAPSFDGGDLDALAEFAALIAERCAEEAGLKSLMLPNDSDQTRCYALGRQGAAHEIRSLATRWRSVIPSTPEKE